MNQNVSIKNYYLSFITDFSSASISDSQLGPEIETFDSETLQTPRTGKPQREVWASQQKAVLQI